MIGDGDGSLSFYPDILQHVQVDLVDHGAVVARFDVSG